MFEPEEQPTSNGEPEQEAGSMLGRFLSRLGMPAQLGMPPRSGPSELNRLGLQRGDLPSSGLADRPRLPRYYGAPPDHLPPQDLAPFSKVPPGDETDRVKFMLRMASDRAQPSEPPSKYPYSYNSPAGIGAAASRSSFARPEASDNRYRPNVSTYLAPTLNRLVSESRPSAATFTGTPNRPQARASLSANRISASAASGGSGPETNRPTVPIAVSPGDRDQPRSAEGAQLHELVPNRDNRNLVQPNVLDSKTAGNSASPQAAKTTKTAPGTQTGTVTGKQAPGDEFSNDGQRDIGETTSCLADDKRVCHHSKSSEYKL